MSDQAYCIYNDVGRVSWVENLTATHPTGDCDGPLGRVAHPADLTRKAVSAKHERVVHLCQRHHLQVNGYHAEQPIPIVMVKS